LPKTVAKRLALAIQPSPVLPLRPVESQFGARGNYAHLGAPAGCLTPEGSRDPSDTTGPGVA